MEARLLLTGRRWHRYLQPGFAAVGAPTPPRAAQRGTRQAFTPVAMCARPAIGPPGSPSPKRRELHIRQASAALRPTSRLRRHSVRMRASPENTRASANIQANAVSLWEQAKTAPREPGVYFFRDNRDEILYIGKAVSLRARVLSYLTKDESAATGASPSTRLGPRLAHMVDRTASLDYIATVSEAAALAMEANMIKEHKPRYNVLLKNDRRHPYAVITYSEEFPRLAISRNGPGRRNVSKDTSSSSPGRVDKYFGPYVDEAQLKALLGSIQKAIPLRQRPKPLHPSRTCLNFDVGKCPGPCQDLISPKEYNKLVQIVDMLLSGRTDEAFKVLETQLQAAVERMDFEEAALLRDRRDELLCAYQSQILNSANNDAVSAAAVVALKDTRPRDIIAAAADLNGHAKVALLQVRAGSVMNRLVFTVDDTYDSQVNRNPVQQESSEVDLEKQLAQKKQLAAAAANAALSSHYGMATDASEIPAELVLTSGLEANPELTILGSMLSHRKGTRVRIVHGSNDLRKISEIAQRNADLELEVARQRQSRVDGDLKNLAQLLHPFFPDLRDPARIRRIECFDVSHLAGSNTFGSMAVLVNGTPVPSQHRRYKLPDDVIDDYESMKQILRRRLSKHEGHQTSSAFADEDTPSLIVIDGGKGQLSAAVEALAGSAFSTMPMVAIAKREEKIFVYGQPVAINEDLGVTPGVRLLCRARDEAHRVAITAHRNRRRVSMFRTGLEGIPGLGKARQEALLKHFPGGVKAMSMLSAEEIARVPGIGPETAIRVHAALAQLGDDQSEAPDLGGKRASVASFRV